MLSLVVVSVVYGINGTRNPVAKRFCYLPTRGSERNKIENAGTLSDYSL